MDRSMYVAMTAAKHNMLAQNIHANNLANVSTQGFKADFAQARSMGVYYGDGYPTRAFALTETPGLDFSQGTAMATDRYLDVALENQGFIAVQTPDGGEAFTRNGSLYVDSFGIMRTGNNLPVIGEGGPVSLPEFDKIEIGHDGTISVVVKGEKPDALAILDRIKLVNPEEGDIEKSLDGLFRLKEPGIAPPDANVRLLRGFLESSNVNPVSELTNILTLSRQFEMSLKMLKNAEENSQASARLLQIT